MASSGLKLGFIGLGDMGAPMARNIAAAGFDLVVSDKFADSDRCPEGARWADNAGAIAAAAETVFLCVPDGTATLSVMDEVVGTPGLAAKTLINLSTVGVEAAHKADEISRQHGIVYVDGPVSGGQTGAAKGTVTFMWSGKDGWLNSHQAVLAAFTGRTLRVGDQPGQGQAMKLLNNYLSAVAMMATTEATSFGLTQGLEMKTMLDVLNISTGQNTATSDKFPNRILSGTYDAGFRTALMTKDIELYFKAMSDEGSPNLVSDIVLSCWQDAAKALPDSDFTEIYKYIRDGAQA
jgi:3-hydroxyisobutyrate dehydrogenase